MWHKDAFNYDSHVMENGFIATFGQHLRSKTKCVVVNVYAPCILSEKVSLWEELFKIRYAHQNLSWCFCSDFNAVRCVNERKGTRVRGSQKSEINDFNSFIERKFLLEIPIVGKKYTWFKSNGSAKSTLDRVLLYEDWIHVWPICKQYLQPREILDHCAMVVKSLVKDWGPRPFRTLMLGVWSVGSRKW